MNTPNILILMADQLAPHYTGAYDHPIVKTPNMERLAERGCRFDAAYTPYPLCAPARFSMLSGQLASRIRAYDNAAEFSSNIPTICHYLNRLGYHSCLTGKMHFIGPDQLHGFSERLTTDIYPADYAFTPNWKFAEHRIHEWYHNMMSVHEAGSAQINFQHEFDDEAGFHGIRRLYDYARDPKTTPFFMVASFTHPHDPYVARPKWWNLYADNEIDMPRLEVNTVPADPHSQRLLVGIQADVDPPADQAVRNARRAYYANTSYVDDWIGQFVDTLDKTGLLDNTIVIFTADHGDMLGERGLWYKMSFFEQSVRVPLIIAGPGIQNATISKACSTIDLLPTLLELVTGRSDYLRELGMPSDGHSLSDLLTGDGSNYESFAISEYSAECASHPMIMLRRNEFKYVHCDADPPMLFNLANDPDELNNLAQKDSHRQIAASFHAEVQSNWDLDALRSNIIADQQARLMVHEAMLENPSVYWDYQPIRDAAQTYIRTHRNIDEMAEVSRLPRFNPNATP